MIPRSHNPVSIILLVQFFVILAGTLLTIAMLKGHGYPDAKNMHWNPIAVVIRNYGWFALFVPVVWYALACKSWKARDSDELSPAFVLALILGTVVMLFFYLYTVMTAGVILI